MKKRIILSAVLLLLIGCTFVFGGCSNDKGTVEIVGAKNIELSYKETSYDFMEGVSCSSGDIIIDSNVVFGKAGSYSVSYKVGNTEIKSTVKIYGEPVVVTKNTWMSYSDVVKRKPAVPSDYA